MVDHVLGDDIAEAAERQMMDIIVQPVFLFGFLKELKTFYMKSMPGMGQGGFTYTKSYNLLMLNVGEIVGTFPLHEFHVVLSIHQVDQ